MDDLTKLILLCKKNVQDLQVGFSWNVYVSVCGQINRKGREINLMNLQKEGYNYRIAGKFGEGQVLRIWQIVRDSPI